jgi:hypothetical protein
MCGRVEKWNADDKDASNAVPKAFGIRGFKKDWKIKEIFKINKCFVIM